LKKQTTLVASAVLALLLTIVVVLRILSVQNSFDQTVRQSLQATAGYDKDFIGMVNRLEQELANRASFGYQGGKDPMTGRVRSVVVQAQPQASPVTSRAQAAAPRVETEKPLDPVKLTAIIFDDKSNRYTAVVMDGERSYSLEVGDRVRGRVIRKITGDIIVMEGDSLYYQYDIFGKCVTRRK
jgi:hypothetical protein